MFDLADGMEFEVFEAFGEEEFYDMPAISPAKGEIWNVRFDPATGAEINKIRPALVMNIAKAGRIAIADGCTDNDRECRL